MGLLMMFWSDKESFVLQHVDDFHLESFETTKKQNFNRLKETLL